ncbi:molybdopterin-dependent oxidoreductase [Psychromonas sp. MME1]|uniref:molybdopterin-dependent oxidoreductase n=2 Tax=unclassified Psychromonas TaxID=2614957 RepID=UPI0034E2AD4A
MENNSWTKTTCAYCGVGCGIEAKSNAQGGVDIRGDIAHPANYGKLCSKGLALGETVSHEGRLLHPSLEGQETNWSTALDHVAQQFSDIIAEHGPDAVAFYVSGQLLTEDYYVANKLMKGFIGSANIDTNSRLCMSSSVVGHKRAFGSDTVPICYEDLDHADMVVITGSNLAWCHPVLFQRLKAAKKLRPELFIVVIDPRKTDSSAIADLHLAIQPGSDVALFNGLLCHLVAEQKINPNYIDSYCEGFQDALKNAQQDCQDERDFLDRLTISKTLLTRFYKQFANTEKVITIYSQGVNQSSQGSDKVNSILNCHLATGRIGKAGMGPFSVTGQPNAMGGREVGGLANTLAAHMEFNNPEEHRLISDFWQSNTVAKAPGLQAIDLFDAMYDGKIKAVWIMATNPVVSLPNSNKIIAALQKCPLVVVSDCIKETATSKYASVLLPAQGWSEKSGTVTNSERRISRQRRLLPTPGEGKPDWWIISEVAKRMGFSRHFSYLHEGEIFNEYARMTTLGNENGKNRDLNLIGLTHLDAQGYSQLTPQQWPVTKLQKKIIHQRMFSDNVFFTPSKKAQFIAVTHQKPKGVCDNNHPFLLNSGRIRDQWHTMTRTGLSSRLSAHIAEPFVNIHPSDAQQQQLNNGDIAMLSNHYGKALARVVISTRIQPQQLFMPIHWNQSNAKLSSVCALIPAHKDSYSGQPEFKTTPVAIQKWPYQSEALLLSDEPLNVDAFAYWIKQKVSNGYLYRIAAQLPAQQLCVKLHNLLAKKSGKTLNYSRSDDHNTPLYRYAHIHNKQILGAYIASNNLQNQPLEWMQNLLDIRADHDVELSFVSGVVKGKLAAGKIICACKQVGENTIKSAIKDKQLKTVQAISDCTGAGTGCGSCLPDIQQLVADYSLSYSA